MIIYSYRRYKDCNMGILEIYCQLVPIALYTDSSTSCIVTDSSVIHPEEYYKSRFRILTFKEDLRKVKFVENSRISKWVF